jgi:hypothetical protein
MLGAAALVAAASLSHTGPAHAGLQSYNVTDREIEEVRV